jgi:hypothetical protein
MGTTLSKAERERRQQFVIDGKAASALGISMEALGTARRAAIEQWTTIIRAQMQEQGVADPVEILPEGRACGSKRSVRRVPLLRSPRVRKFENCSERGSFPHRAGRRGAATFGSLAWCRRRTRRARRCERVSSTVGDNPPNLMSSD